VRAGSDRAPEEYAVLTTAPELSVVLVNYNGAECLGPTLAALARNTTAAAVEGIVVDSGSTDGSWRDVEAGWDRARVIRFEENIGFCAGCNRGAEAARGRFLAFVNFDAEVEPGWDAPLRALLENTQISVATGLVLRPDGETLEAVGLDIAPNMGAYGRCEGKPRETVSDEPVDVPVAPGALMMVRRAEFLELGGFYEPLFMYFEEVDYCLRVPGRIILHPASAVRHALGHASGPVRSPIRLYRGSRNRLLTAARHLPPLALAKSVLLSAAFDALTLLQLRSRHAAREVLQGWRDGLRLMRRARMTRTPRERRLASKRLVPLREAVAQQRRLGRL
jgi:N-acetylglucosaminyl-diphospho-decaprenol L-rhamnosyltransferase